MSMIRFFVAAAVALCWASQVLAQPEATTGAGAARVDGPIWVDVNVSYYEVDELGVQVAVAKELGVAISDDAGGARSHASVVIGTDGNMVVSYRDGTGRRLLRAISAPENPQEVPEAAALLLGNLARDQTSALLAELTPAPPPSAPALPKPAREKHALAVEPAVKTAKTEEKLPADSPEQKPPQPLRSAPLNLALAHPINTLQHSERYRVAADLSLAYSRVGAIDAFAVSAGVLVVEREMRGLTATLVGHLHDGAGYGLAAAGLFSVRGGFTGLAADGLFTHQRGPFVGLQLAGAVVNRTGDMHGVEASGAVGLSRGSATGMLAAGAVNVHHGELEGAQFAGAVNVNAGGLRGAQIAGAVNVQHGPLTGAQAAGVVNLTRGDLSGFQFAATNVAADVHGAQIGLVNIGGHVRGLQLGIVNWAEEVDGASIGVVTHSEEGRTQLVTWFDSERPLNLGVRFYTGPLYAMPTIGLRRRGGADEYAPGFSLGARLPVSRLFADLDVNYSTRAPDFQFDEHNIDLRYRGLVGFQVLEDVALFAGGGVLHHMQTDSSTEDTFDPVLNVGVELF